MRHFKRHRRIRVGDCVMPRPRGALHREDAQEPQGGSGGEGSEGPVGRECAPDGGADCHAGEEPQRRFPGGSPGFAVRHR